MQLILNCKVKDLMETMPLSLKNISYQHDGAPVHKAINVINWLNENFNRQWISCKGPTEWPLDLLIWLLDFFLSGQLRTLVYSNRPLDVARLKKKIIKAWKDINIEKLQNVYKSIIKKAQLCIGIEWRHFDKIIIIFSNNIFRI